MKYKSKIIKSREFVSSGEVATFDITLKSAGALKRGKCVIYPKTKAIDVNFGVKLSYFERLTVLKEIFYAFCITEATRNKNLVHEHIEEYAFIDTQDDYSQKDPKSIIETIMEYDKEDFDIFKKKEKIIAYVKDSCFKIQKEKDWDQRAIRLQTVSNFSKREIEVYKKILCKYLKSHKLEGRLVDVSYKYRQEYTMFNPYYMNPCTIYAFEYEISNT